MDNSELETSAPVQNPKFFARPTARLGLFASRPKLHKAVGYLAQKHSYSQCRAKYPTALNGFPNSPRRAWAEQKTNGSAQELGVQFTIMHTNKLTLAPFRVLPLIGIVHIHTRTTTLCA